MESTLLICAKSSTTSNKRENTIRGHSKPSTFAMLSFSFFLIVTHNSLVAISVDLPSSYEPTDTFSLDCSSDLASVIDRMGSLNPSKTNFYVVSKDYTREPSYSGKPQVWVHKKQFTYTFPISPGPKFIRLYFNPIPYSGFHISKALFSVSAGHYTLLKTSNDSYSESKLDADHSYTVKEYCINIDDQVLNVTFIPSRDVPDAFAFVSKIEVVSMPSNLYIREVVPLPLIGQPSLYYVKNSRALEMMHRLNIGGDLIPAHEDIGMFREWIPDASFLTTDESDTVIVNSHVQIKRSSVVPVYVAPEKVYASARTVAAGSNQGGARWLLPVDSGFYYLVRLHFCEISKKIHGVDQRVFHVYIKNQTAEDHADIFGWGHGDGIPVYRDYIVNFSEHTKGRKYLSLSIENSNDSIKTTEPAILNGLEIFKLSDFNDSLAGPFSFGMGKSSKQSRNNDVIDKALRIFLIFLCISIILAIIWQIVVVIDSKGQRETFMQSPSSDHCQSFSFDEVKLATNNFSEALLLGAGGYGKVYKGSINDGTNFVAIKRANPSSHQGLKEFHTEILLLSQLRHCHLVSLIGCCKEKKEMILVYDYMANGTLRDHLYKTKKPPLSWKRRLTICIGAARGLHYLHTGAKHKIIHRDVKSTNILLHENWVAKVSDFGLSKIGPNMLTQSNTHVTTMVKGSFGYMDPEYYKRQKLTEKSDVYSFGVVLFEVLCARPAVLQVTENMEEEPEKVNLAEYALHCYRSGTLDQIIDPYLQGKIDPTCLKTFTDVATKCLADKGSERPTMGEVLWNLEQAWQQQESARFENDGNCGVADTNTAGGLPEILDVRGVHRNGSSDPTPGVEFSEIIVPIGR